MAGASSEGVASQGMLSQASVQEVSSPTPADFGISSLLSRSAVVGKRKQPTASPSRVVGSAARAESAQHSFIFPVKVRFLSPIFFSLLLV